MAQLISLSNKFFAVPLKHQFTIRFSDPIVAHANHGFPCTLANFLKNFWFTRLPSTMIANISPWEFMIFSISDSVRKERHGYHWYPTLLIRRHILNRCYFIHVAFLFSYDGVVYSAAFVNFSDFVSRKTRKRNKPTIPTFTGTTLGLNL